MLHSKLPVGEHRILTSALAELGIHDDKHRFGFDVLYKRKPYHDAAGNCPKAERLARGLLQIPVHPNISPEILERVGSLIREIVR